MKPNHSNFSNLKPPRNSSKNGIASKKCGAAQPSPHKILSLKSSHNDKFKKVLIQYLNTRKEIEGDLDLNAPLITNQMSGKFSSASLQQCFKKMYESVGIDASSHSGRRSFCTNLSECGVSITNLQTLMGHQSISTT